MLERKALVHNTEQLLTHAISSRLPKPLQATRPDWSKFRNTGVLKGNEATLKRRDSIDSYTNSELRQLAEWVASDGLLRTDDEFVRCMLEELPFNPLGARIRERLEGVVRQVTRTRRSR